MDTGIFFQEKPFSLWSMTHGIPVLILIIFAIFVILYGKSLPSRKKKKNILILLAFIPFIALMIQIIIVLVRGTFTIQADLPIHICRLLALTAPLVYWKEHKFWTGIFYFWILVGTLNAVIAADIRHDFPHWNYLTYFVVHQGLIIPVSYTHLTLPTTPYV